MKKRVVFAVLLALLLLMTCVSAQYYDSKGYYHDEYGKVYKPGQTGIVGQTGTVGQAFLRETDTSGRKKSAVSTITGFILDVFSLKWLKTNPDAELDGAAKFAAITRFMIWLTVLILVNYGLQKGLGDKFTSRSRKVLATVVATIAAIFIPPAILIGIGGLYGAMIALVFLGVPLIMAIVLVFAWKDTSRITIIIKMAILTALIWLFGLMNTYLPTVKAAGGW